MSKPVDWSAPRRCGLRPLMPSWEFRRWPAMPPSVAGLGVHEINDGDGVRVVPA